VDYFNQLGVECEVVKMIYISEIRDPVFIWVGLSLAPAVQGCGLF
jgi:hypothetical protein